MAIVDLIMPKLGESITEATILKWHKQPGDTVKMDETVLDIATDKVDSEVPSTAEGVIESILYNVNDIVPVGGVIARIKTDAIENISSTPVITQPAQEQTANQKTQEAVMVETVHATNNCKIAATNKWFFQSFLFSPGAEYSRQRRHQHDGTGKYSGNR